MRQLGQVAGVGGIALGVLVLVFRDVVRKNIFPNLAKDHAYKIIRLVLVLTFGISATGLAAWVYVQTHVAPSPDIKFPKADVRPVIDEYLRLIDTRQYQEAWDSMADLAHERYQYDMLKQAFVAQREPLGGVVNRKLRSIGPVTRLADGTVGAFVMTEYETKFERSSNTYLEQVYAVGESAAWKVFAHVVNPCPAGFCTK